MSLVRSFCLALLLSGAAHAQTSTADWSDRQLPDAQQEAQARDLMNSLRCVQCQAQAVGDSDAPVAAAMRNEIRIRVARGESSAAIRHWLVARYGQWVSYDPAFGASTALLWLAPLLFLAGGAAIAWLRLRGTRGS